MKEQSVQVSPIGLNADLALPDNPEAIVLFAHGSGSSRFSSRNRFVAETLHHYRFATLLMDLLTREEEQVDLRTAHLRFDIHLLASRLVQATEWLRSRPDTSALRLGYFGASTGAAAALVAAAGIAQETPSHPIRAVVSRGGRPDLAAAALQNVRAPTLLIVGARDPQVLTLNQAALKQLTCEKHLEIIPRATHLFEEQGALEEVARLASDWFQRHLSPSA